MIVDTSAIVTVVMQEPGFQAVVEKLTAADHLGVGTPALTETAIVLSARLRDDARGLVSRFLFEGSFVTVPFLDAHFEVALDAWLRYGKGRHAAALNVGDCMSYAIARVAQEPLLCTGDDFGKTDIELA
jgi:ribonuclease VapC